MRKLVAIFSIPELRQKILITIGFLIIYRIGYFVPLPFIDQVKLTESMNASGALGNLLGMVSLFSGGNLSNACIFALGIMPYISASIMFQLFAVVYPPLEKLQKEGEVGRKKINEYTRYFTVVVCIVQSIMIVKVFMSDRALAVPGWDNPWATWPTMVLIMTAGTIFLMWIGEQIDEYGIGNGISLIIMAGIVARIPDATTSLLFDQGQLRKTIFTLGGQGSDVSFEKIVVLLFLFIAVVVGVIAMTKAQRRIPTQSAKHVRGRRVYGGTRQFLPMKLNAAGVMPVIFAGTLLVIPGFIFMGIEWMTDGSAQWATKAKDMFQRQGYTYNLCYIAMIYFFTYFWTAIMFNPKEMANSLKEHGSFIPGYRPGKRTAEYLERVMMRVTYVGAAFLAIVAVIPSVIQSLLNIDYRVASFYGGTGLLIVVSVALDLVQKINSHLVMRNYEGLTDD